MISKASCIKEIENDYDFSMRKAFYELKHGKTDDESSIKSDRFACNAVTASGAMKNDITQSLTRNVAVASRVMTEYMLNANPKVQDAIISILELIDVLLPREKRFFMFACKDLIDAEKMLEKAKSNSESIGSVLMHQWPAEVLKILDLYLGVGHKTASCRSGAFSFFLFFSFLFLSFFFFLFFFFLFFFFFFSKIYNNSRCARVIFF